MKKNEEELKITLKKCEQREASIVKELEAVRKENVSLINQLKDEKAGMNKIIAELEKSHQQAELNCKNFKST